MLRVLGTAGAGGARRAIAATTPFNLASTPRHCYPAAAGPIWKPRYVALAQTSNFPAGSQAPARVAEISARSEGDEKRATQLHFSGFKWRPPALAACEKGPANAATFVAAATANPKSSAQSREVAPLARLSASTRHRGPKCCQRTKRRQDGGGAAARRRRAERRPRAASQATGKPRPSQGISSLHGRERSASVQRARHRIQLINVLDNTSPWDEAPLRRHDVFL